MSECIVRMEMPKSCKNCHFRFDMYCGLAKKDIFPEYILLENRPYWCPIICQLPDGHGRLVDINIVAKRIKDAEELSEFCDEFEFGGRWTVDLSKIPTIVPAERKET